MQWTWAMVIWAYMDAANPIPTGAAPVEIPNFQSQGACQRELERIKQFSKGYFNGVCINKAEK